MRVGIVHNAYRVRGGEERVVAAEARLLERAGSTVHRFIVDNRCVGATLGSRLRLAAGPGLGWNPAAGDALDAWIRHHRLDVVHVHNVHPVLTAAVPQAAADLRVPVVATLHNRRLLCANGTLTRDGRPCEECLGGDSRPAIRHGCARGSRMQSISWALGRAREGRRRTWAEQVHLLIAPSRAVRDDHVRAGYARDRIVVRPHFTAAPESDGPIRPPSTATGVLFAGRLDPMKGIDRLVRAWPADGPHLTVAGTGPLEAALRASGAPGVRMLGDVPPEAMPSLIAAHRLVVQPSLVPESFGLTAIEAAACGRPTVAFGHGGACDVIVDHVTGRLIRPGDIDGLVAAAVELASCPRTLRRFGEAAGARHRARYSEEAGLRSLLAIYERAASIDPEPVRRPVPAEALPGADPPRAIGSIELVG